MTEKGHIWCEGTGARTQDNLIKSQVLYRLSYTLNDMEALAASPYCALSHIHDGRSIALARQRVIRHIHGHVRQDF